MDVFMTLIKSTGWLASSMDCPVMYDVTYFKTKQEYFKSEPVSIWVFDNEKGKRRMVTLRIPSDKSDPRKTETATVANFIHQKDAYIAYAHCWKVS
jgi:hypothetical protein